MDATMYDQVAGSVAALYNSLPGACTGDICPQAEWAGCVLRMAGHDFMDFDSTTGLGGADACTDMDAADNAGLLACLAHGENGVSLSQAYSQFCHAVSLADFLVIAAEAVMVESRKHALQPGQPVDVNFRDQFRFGRTTRVQGCAFAEGQLPNPTMGCQDVDRVFVQHLGLTPRAAAALMAVHTLGRARLENSGFNGWWSDEINSRKFNNDYFVSLLAKGWIPEHNINGNPAKHQWQRADKGRTAAKEMMLATDMCLAFKEDGQLLNAFTHNCCAWYEPPNQAGGLIPGVIENNGNLLCGQDASTIVPMTLALQQQCCDPAIDTTNQNGVFSLSATGTPQANDCGNPNQPDGYAANDVMQFAANENAWLAEFMPAWQHVTNLGFGILGVPPTQPLQPTCQNPSAFASQQGGNPW